MNAVVPSSDAIRRAYPGSDPSRRVTGWVVVAGVHLLIAYALVSGTARKGLELITKPLEAVVIQEVIIPPPPLPPPPPQPKEIRPPDAPKQPQVQAPPQPFAPPPEVPTPVAAPTMVTTPTLPTQPTPIAPPPAPVAAVAAVAAPAPTAPPLPAKPASAEIGVVCPTQVKPEMPRRAVQDGVEGVVRARALVANGSVKEVTILSGPRVFHDVVRNAMLKYRCDADARDVLATQEFVFRVE